MTELNHKVYTAADFERYYSGKMSNAEMHALEKSALDDPFLADALEGYSYTKTPVNDVAELKERLSKKNKRNRTFLLQNKAWLRVAASVILFAGLSYTVYELNSKKSFLAANEVKKIVRANDSTLTTQNDSTGNDETVPSVNVPELKSERSADNKNGYVQKQDIKKTEVDSSKTTAYNFSISKNKDAIKNNETAFSTKISQLKNEQKLDSWKGYFETPAMKKFQVDSSKTTAYNFSMSENKNAKPENKTHLLGGKLIDTAGKALVIAGIKVSDKETVVTDSLSRIKLNTKDSLQMAAIEPTGYKTKQRNLARNADQVKMMDSVNRSLEEVVVTADVSKKKNVEAPLTGKVTGISFNDPNYGPIGGWEKFDRYLSDNISFTANEKKDKFSTKVVLSFEVDENGDPKKVKVEQSQCKECDKEALRLLQSGPKWKYVSGKKYVIDVQF